MAEEKQLLMVTDSSRKRLNEEEEEEESSNKKGKTSAPHQLPHEIIVEILSRLPVKTLIRFRCVSKLFKTLISDAHFIKTHLTNSRHLSRSRLVVLSRGGSALSVLNSCPLQSIFDNDALQLHSYSFSSHNHYWLVGSCDGLICLALKQESVTLLNPSTRVLHELPYLGFQKKFGSYTVFGFGYDSQNDDYKVVAVFCYQTTTSTPNRGIGYQTIVEVSSLASRRWTRIGSFAYGVPYDVSGKYVDGTLNWPVMYQGDSGLMWDVVSFDLAKETYKEVMQPDYGELGYDRTLGVFDGWLCVMCNYRAVRADLWVMKQYGVRESWVKLVSIPYLDHPGSFWYSVPYGISDNGEVLMEFNSLVIYNPKDGTFRYPMMGNTDTWGEPETYIETLVSPKVEN